MQDSVSAGTKRCPKCGEILPVCAFARKRSTRDGLQGDCKTCFNAIRTRQRRALGVGPRQYSPIAERIAAQSTAGDNGCILWTGCKLPRGHGLLSVHYKHQYVHRLAYELARGPIPDGFVIDHLCGIPNCVNPNHMEAILPKEHSLRSQLNYWRGASEVPEYQENRTDWTPIGPTVIAARRAARPAPPPRPLRLGDVAQRLGVSRQRIHQIAQREGIGTYVPGRCKGRWTFSEEDIAQIVARRGLCVSRGAS